MQSGIEAFKSKEGFSTKEAFESQGLWPRQPSNGGQNTTVVPFPSFISGYGRLLHPMNTPNP
jgi:hypothetical protein